MRANGTAIPIPGAAGVAIHSALNALAMKTGEGVVKVHKKPVAGGGYAYEITISDHDPPRAGRFT